MRDIKYIIYFVLLGFTLKSQTDTLLIKSSSAKVLKKLGKSAISQNDPSSAISFFEAYLKKNSSDAKVMDLLAHAYMQIRDYDKAQHMFFKAYKSNSIDAPSALYYHAQMQKSNGLYDSARINFQKFKKEYDGTDKLLKKFATKEIIFCDSVQKITGIEKKIVMTHLDTTINKINTEGAPFFIDENTMVFTSLRTNKKEYIYLEDTIKSLKRKLYIAKRKDNEWKFSGEYGNNFNSSDFNTGNACFSPDKKRIYFTRCNINSKQEMICAIYVSEKNGEEWSEPVKLPSNINTPEEEEFVYIHPDDQTLYFSSDGHVGMGGLDIYVSRRRPDGSWGDPVNLGYPINTYDDERGLLVGPRGDIAYISSDRPGGEGGLDLYSFRLHNAARPVATSFVKGVVVDANNGSKLSSSYEIIDLESGKTMVKSGTEESVGTFLATLPIGKDYLLNVSKEGYLFYSDNFSCKDSKTSNKPYILDIKLEPVTVGSKVVLKNVFFSTNSFDLQKESFTELDKLVSFMKKNPNVVIEVSGHTDNVGDKKSNQILSNNRAKSVMDYLKSKGIESARMTSIGLGDSKPISDNGTEEGRASNRRTEFRITSMK